MIDKINQYEKKLMATVSLAEGVQITLLGSKRDDDLISQFLKKARGSDIHHIAFLVEEIRSCLAQLQCAVPGFKRIGEIAEDAPLSQVFTMIAHDHRIIELVERRLGFRGGFTCANIATLTAGELKKSIDEQSR